MPLRALIVAALVALPVSVGAQDFSPIILGGDANTVRVVRDVATSQLLEGSVLGARASLSFRRLQLEGRYAEGSLVPSGVLGAEDEKYVDALVIARVNLNSYLSFGAGPHLRAFVTPAGTARWSRIEIHARTEGDLINGLARVRIDAWLAPSANSNVQGGGSGAMGGEAGLLLRIPNTPTALHVMYTADRATFANGGSEFVEGIRVGLVLDRILSARSAAR
jgi:hypothetical protein